MKPIGRATPSWVAKGAVAAVCVAFLASGCSGDPSDSSAAPGGEGSSATGATESPTPEVETTSLLGKVSGKLPKGKRSKARKQVTHAVDAWFDAAYLGGDYPRNDFSTSWPGFTTGAKDDAHADKALMSNEGIGTDVDTVEAKTRKVTVDVLAARGRAVGATARFVLRFRTDGKVARKIEVRGRLFLTPSPEGWRIFGYDVTKGRWA